MRALGASRTSVVPGGVLAGNWVRNPLWTRARAVPSLDLRFADNKSLVDATTGASLVTFTRASTGTFVGSDGVLRSAVTNLLLRSEEFNDASWTKANTTVTANSIAAPNGTVTADTITDSSDASAVVHSVTSQNQSFTSGLSYTLSVYSKAGTQPGIAFLFPAAAFTSNLNARFNISTGTIASLDSGLTGSITDVGDGWYRCTATATATTTASSSTTVQIRIATASTSFYQGNGTGTISLWGAQLEQSSTVGEYIPTTSTINSAPRFDHNPTTGESLGLLVEEARTNSFVRSEEFGTTWTATGLSSITADAATAPNGATTADTLVETTGVSEVHRVLQNTSITSGLSYTVSVFAKQAQRRYCYLLFTPNNTWNGTSTIADFDLQTGTIVNTANCTATITAFPDGWYRLTATTTATATNAAAPIGIGASSTGSVQTYTGDGSNAITIWGAQFETGAFATSYILNVNTPLGVTRAADVAQITGSNFSSWYNQTEGTVFADASVVYSAAISLFSLDDNTTNNRIQLRNSNFAADIRVVAAGASQATLLTSNTTAANVRARHACAYKLNDLAVTLNSGTVATQSTALLPVATQATFTTAPGSATTNATIRRLTYWPTRLANTTLQSITAP